MKKAAEERRDAATVVNAVMEDWLFQTPMAAQIDPSNLRKMFHRLLVDAGMRRIRFHDLRHSVSSILLENNVHPKLVAELLGHSNVSLTLNRYSHKINPLNTVASDMLNKAITTP